MYQASETREEQLRAEFIAATGDAAADIADRWVQEIVFEGQDSVAMLVKRHAENKRVELSVDLANALRKHLTPFELANNGDEDFEQYVEMRS